MPTLTGDRIYLIADRLLRSAGASDENADIVARHLADSNLAGHDSHGFLRIPQYLTEIQEGVVRPEEKPEVVKEGPATAQVNGNATFGQVVAAFATKLAIEKARSSGISLVTMSDLGHTGRVGTYPEMAAREGMAAIMFTGFVGGPGANNVVPFGGRERRLGTNPISMSFPYAPDSPILLDFATSAAAEGKLRVYRAAGKLLPDEWVISKEGSLSRDPNDYYDGGGILPMGGVHGGHKGFALGFMVALYGKVLGRLVGASSTRGVTAGGSSIIVIDLSALAPQDEVVDRVVVVVDYVKDTTPMEGSTGVLYPGEIEATTRRERLANGVPIEQATWDQMAELIRERNLEDELGLLP